MYTLLLFITLYRFTISYYKNTYLAFIVCNFCNNNECIYNIVFTVFILVFINICVIGTLN